MSGSNHWADVSLPTVLLPLEMDAIAVFYQRSR
jgi:hypothetical protein